MLHAFGLLCGLSAVAFAARVTRWATAAVLVGAFAGAAAVLPPGRIPAPSWVAAAAALGAGAALWRPTWSFLPAACGGLTSAVWAALLEAQGLPGLPAHAVALALTCLSACLAWRRPGFAPARLTEDALMLVAAFGAVVAASPAIADGLQAALALKAVPLSTGSPPAAPWSLSLAAVCLLAGMLYSLWKRR